MLFCLGVIGSFIDEEISKGCLLCDLHVSEDRYKQIISLFIFR